MRSRLAFLVAALGLAFVTPAAHGGEKNARKPNVIVIVADDLGYADLGCQGCKDIPTPHIDSLAKNGARCTDGYVTCPVCSPTRAGLITGRYQQRFGHEFNPGTDQDNMNQTGLPLSQKTLADLLKALGYRTGLVGKWHLGYRPEFHPQKRGFDEFFGFLGGAHPYFPGQAGKGNPIYRGTEVVDEKEYLTDAFTREAVAFLERHRKEPFLLMLTYNAVHGPIQPPERHVKRFAHIDDPLRRSLAAMHTALDEGVGAVLAKLRDLGLEEDTLIFFVSDNGGPTKVNASRNTPLRGFKNTLWEGGVRVPFLVQWKGRIPAGQTFRHPVVSLDIMATALEAAGGKSETKLDGTNLLPHLTGKTTAAPHETLTWRYGTQWAIRKGNWKLSKAEGEIHLADLASDPGEATNLAAKRPEVVRELTEVYQQWNAELAEPLWRVGKSSKEKPKKKKDVK